uniref:NRF domain-containing protein n=1 Tax=Caenorhabditis tropicalis TaxID=1561998 RepID=A0A1I7V4Z8_9PELO
MPKFCNASKQLPVEPKCREQFEKIFCSADRWSESLDCQSIANKSLNEQEQCSQCAYQKANNGWVLRWFDSLGKPAAGITEGNYYWLGDYELCAALTREGSFDGQYCRIEMEVPDAGVESGCPQTDPLSIILGVCFPSACSVPDLAKVSSMYLPYNLKVECESQSRWSVITLILLIIFGFWMIPQMVSTIQSSQNDSILTSFCISENAKRTFSTRRETPHLHVVHGLEFLLFFTIISGMVYNFMLPYIENVAFSFEGVTSFPMHIVNNYSYQIDGLLALSAFYTTYLLFGNIPTIRSAFDVILLRLSRFWPAYIVCVIFMYMIFPGISSGPMWIHTDTVNRCEGGWWKNILFINNWFNVTDTCTDIGYIISMEAQYFVILVFVIFLSSKWPILTQVFAYSILLISIGFAFIRAYSQSLPPAPMLTVEPEPLEKTYALFDQLMLSFLARSNNYCLGFIFGIGCATSSEELRQSGLRYTGHKVLAFLCIFSAIFPFIGAFPYSAWASNYELINAFYASVHRPMWSFAILSFVYLCHQGAFKWMNAILGWRAFSPLSKVTWISLVIAEPTILFFFSSLNKPAHATHWSTMYTAISTALISYVIALALDIFVTRPIRYLVYPEQRHRYAQAHTQEQRGAAQ